MRSLFTKRVEPNHRVRRLGQDRQGMELGQLQAQGQPLWSQRLLEHRHRLPRRFPLRLRWQGRPGYALGLERQQALVHPGQRRQHQRPLLLAKQILALRCHRQLHQNLGKSQHTAFTFTSTSTWNWIWTWVILFACLPYLILFARIWSTRSSWTSSRPRSPHQSRDSCHSACPWHGPLMARPCTPVTPITSSVSGKCLWLDKRPAAVHLFLHF